MDSTFLRIKSMAKKLDELRIRRVLPSIEKRSIGPFVFLDHMGPHTFKPDQSMTVGVHPHIGLSTLTYLFEGRIQHHDSLACKQVIEPGAVNWMTAGSGISHSERSVKEDLGKEHKLHGLQFWLALPDALEQVQPSFEHYSKDKIPKIKNANYELDVILGEFKQMRSPVSCTSDSLFVHIKANAECEIEFHTGEQELGVYIVEQSLQYNSQDFATYELLYFSVGQEVKLKLSPGARIAIIGGKPWQNKRHIWWNFVASSKEKIQEAKAKWNAGQMPLVPGESDILLAPDK